MKLKTYRINQKNYDLVEKMYFFRSIRDTALRSDRFWHFFLDPKGATFRFSPESEEKVRLYLFRHAEDRGLTWKRSADYEPLKHEYFGVSFLGDDILPMFHEMSLLATKYPTYIIVRPILERLNHGLINMTGIHHFGYEAELYMDLAFSRARLVNHSFRLPKWFYKRYLNTVFWIKRHYEKFKLRRRTV